jgi:hypothetical protein
LVQVRIFFKFHRKNKKFQELDRDVTADFFCPAGKTGRIRWTARGHWIRKTAGLVLWRVPPGIFLKHYRAMNLMAVF